MVPIWSRYSPGNRACWPMAIPACHNSPCNPPPKFVWSHAMLGRNKSNATLNPGQVDTLIGPQVSIRGDVTFSGGLYVEGRIHGAVCAEEGAKAILTRTEERHGGKDCVSTGNSRWTP